MNYRVCAFHTILWQLAVFLTFFAPPALAEPEYIPPGAPPGYRPQRFPTRGAVTGDDGHVRVEFDKGQIHLIERGKRVRTLEHAGCSRVDLASNTSFLLSRNQSTGTCRLWRWNGQCVREWKDRRDVMLLAPDGTIVAYGSVADGNVKSDLGFPLSAIYRLSAAAVDGRLLYSRDVEGTIPLGERGVMSRDGRLVLLCEPVSNVSLIEARTGNVIWTDRTMRVWEGSTWATSGLVWRTDEGRIYLAGRAGPSPRLLTTLKQRIWSIEGSRDGRRILVHLREGDKKGGKQVIDARTGRIVVGRSH